jgi:hypothetical protein
MKYAIILAAVVATSASAVSPATSKTMSCSGAHLSKMTTMVGGMPDGPHKWEMYKHLEMVNIAMAKDGMRGWRSRMLGSKPPLGWVRTPGLLGQSPHW